MSDKPFRPQLAYSETPSNLEEYEVHIKQAGYLLGSMKLDGIRAVRRGGPLVSRTLKAIPSAFAQTLAIPEYEHFDGELLIKPQPIPEGQTIYHLTYSSVMTHGANDPLDWWIFDWCNPEAGLPYIERLAILHDEFKKFDSPHLKLLEQRPLHSAAEIAAMEQEALDGGYEGLIVRRPDSPYHTNRSSWKQGYLMKVVRKLMSDAVIEDITEMMHNENEPTIDARGFTKRTSHKENKTGTGMMGAFWAKDIHSGVVFKCGIGKGMDHAMREDIFKNWPRDKGRPFRYSFKPYGTKDKPRQPQWDAWRDWIDIGVPADAT